MTDAQARSQAQEAPARTEARRAGRVRRWQPGLPVGLETERFILRSMAPTDITNRYIAWAADAELMQNVNSPPRDMSREQLARYVGRFNNRSSFHLGVFCKEDGLQIGFYNVHCDLRSRTAQTAVIIGDRNFWGQKVVVETRGRILEFLFDEVGMEKVWGTPFDRNFPSIYNYKAQGFQLEGILRSHRVAADGRRVNQYMFGLLREEWLARRQGAGT